MDKNKREERLVIVGLDGSGGTAIEFHLADPDEVADLAKERGINMVFYSVAGERRFDELEAASLTQEPEEFLVTVERYIMEEEGLEEDGESGNVVPLRATQRGVKEVTDVVIVGYDSDGRPTASFPKVDPNNIEDSVEKAMDDHVFDEVAFWVDHTDKRYKQLHNMLDDYGEDDETWEDFLQLLIDLHYRERGVQPPQSPWSAREKLLMEKVVDAVKDTVSDVTKAKPPAVQLRVNYGVILLAVVILAIVPYVLATAAFRPQQPVVNLPEIKVQVDPSRIAENLINRAEFDPDTGLFTPLPPEADDAAVFTRNCIDVCRADGRWSDMFNQAEDRIEPRVLVNDPEHRICTCLTGTITRRYVDWRRTSP